jgi:NACalpha-BTF3-like transcription factor
MGQEYINTIDERDIRLVVLQTNAGLERFESKKKKALKELEYDIAQVNKKIFVCEQDAIKEWERFKKSP